MATFPTRPVMDKIPVANPFPNTGIVPVGRAQPFANDPGEAARLAANRVNMMPPAAMDRAQIVPVGDGGPRPRVIPTMSAPVATDIMAPIREENKLNNNGGGNWDARLARWQDHLARLPAAAQPQFQAAIDRRVANHDERMMRRQSRAQRIAEIMANRPNLGANGGLLGQGFAVGEPYPLQRRG